MAWPSAGNAFRRTVRCVATRRRLVLVSDNTTHTLIETGFLAGTDGPNAYGLPSSGSPFAESTPMPTQTWIN